MWEPAARPTYPQMIFAGPPPAPAAARPDLRTTIPRLPNALIAEAQTAEASTPDHRPAPGHRPTPGPNPASASALEARRLVESLLRLTLEIVDRRRRPEQLKGMATQPVIDALAVLSVNSPPGRELGTAVLRKIRVTAAGDRAAEICASYTRGPRVFAIAGRIERRRDLWVATTLLLA